MGQETSCRKQQKAVQTSNAQLSNSAQEQRGKLSNSFTQSEIRQTGTRINFSKPQKVQPPQAASLTVL